MSSQPSPWNQVLADKLKEKGSRHGQRQWTMDENVALFKIVKKVEEDGASASGGGNQTSTFWQVVAAEAAILIPDRGAAAACSHYHKYLADLPKSLPAGQFDALAHKLKVQGSRFEQRARAAPSPAAPEHI